jgi:hypothetical protein
MIARNPGCAGHSSRTTSNPRSGCSSKLGVAYCNVNRRPRGDSNNFTRTGRVANYLNCPVASNRFRQSLSMDANVIRNDDEYFHHALHLPTCEFMLRAPFWSANGLKGQLRLALLCQHRQPRLFRKEEKLDLGAAFSAASLTREQSRESCSGCLASPDLPLSKRNLRPCFSMSSLDHKCGLSTLQLSEVKS